MSTNLDARRKKLLYRCGHTGTKETDLLLGAFARDHLAELSPVQVDRLEALVVNPDPDLFNWISGRVPVPPEWDNDVFRLICRYQFDPDQP